MLCVARLYVFYQVIVLELNSISDSRRKHTNTLFTRAHSEVNMYRAVFIDVRISYISSNVLNKNIEVG